MTTATANMASISTSWRMTASRMTRQMPALSMPTLTCPASPARIGAVTWMKSPRSGITASSMEIASWWLTVTWGTVAGMAGKKVWAAMRPIRSATKT